MTKPIDAAGADWPALRRRFAGEALANVLAFCGCDSDCRRKEGTGEGLLLTAGPTALTLPVGPVTPLWRGEPLGENVPLNWPRRVAPDAARFFLTARPLAEPVTLDFDLASRLDGGNTCYFTCYTLKRLCALLSRPEPEGLSASGGSAGPARSDGRALVLTVGRFPAAVRRGMEALDPCFVNRYAVELAGEVWRFLCGCPPMGEARLLVQAAEVALRNALNILNLKEESP